MENLPWCRSVRGCDTSHRKKKGHYQKKMNRTCPRPLRCSSWWSRKASADGFRDIATNYPFIEVSSQSVGRLSSTRKGTLATTSGSKYAGIINLETKKTVLDFSGFKQNSPHSRTTNNSEMLLKPLPFPYIWDYMNLYIILQTLQFRDNHLHSNRNSNNHFYYVND